jgi:peptidyl-dipeptidase A
MSLTLDDQNPEEIFELFNELDELTKDSFAKLKDEMDTHLAKLYNVKKDELMPWHYQDKFFQLGPKLYNVDLDKYYKNKNIEELTVKYFNSIGLPIADLVKRSDLYEKENKYQHAYCTNIDRKSDIRVVCNIKDNEYWMGTMLHEFGHAVYEKYFDMELPWTLREPSHTFTTEAIAMLLGRMSTNARWIKDNIGISNDEKQAIEKDSFNTLRLQQLTFSRWVQVVYRFEKNMYENPNQDLNTLWWDLVEKYQLMKKPISRNKPDWASKIHIALYPAYYHNYLLGELLASQLHNYIVEAILKSKSLNDHSYTNNKKVGEYLIKNVFNAANKYYWNEMIEKATGEKLTAKYYSKQFL